MSDSINSYVRYNDNLIVDFIKIENELYDDISDMLEVETKKSASTVLYNDFNTEIDAYYFSLSSLFTSVFCSIYRKTYSQTYFDYVCTLYSSINLKDYNIHNNDYYEYMAVVAAQKSDGSYSYMLYENKDEYDEKIYSATKWGDWSICNITETTGENVYTKTGDTWLLGLNLSSENLTQNLSITSWDTLGQYPKISIGERDYIGSTITCLLGRMEEITSPDDIDEKVYKYTERVNLNTEYPDSATNYTKKMDFEDSEYSREIEKYQDWLDFCSDGELKLLKDIKGNAWIVQISTSPESSYNVLVSGAPTTITFNWVEVMSLNDISIVV